MRKLRIFPDALDRNLLVLAPGSSDKAKEVPSQLSRSNFDYSTVGKLVHGARSVRSSSVSSWP